MSINYAEACAAICASPAPLLYIDTCILLDVIRAPVRETVNSDTPKIALSLQDKSRITPKNLWLITSETVQAEWQENIDGVIEEVEREILRLESRRAHFLSAAKAVTNMSYQRGQVESSIDLAVQLKNLSQRLLDACVIISPEDTHILGAMNRIKKNIPPARRGKSEPKDCEIYELFLGLCRDLRARGIADIFVFSSSNVKEYGPENSGGIHSELNCTGAKYASNLAWAEAILNGRA